VGSLTAEDWETFAQAWLSDGRVPASALHADSMDEDIDTAVTRMSFTAKPHHQCSSFWWPGFCLGFDVMAGVYLALLLKSGRIRADR